MGTARMGADPATSVVSPEQRLWDVDNVLVCDSSVFVTAVGLQPHPHPRRPGPPRRVPPGRRSVADAAPRVLRSRHVRRAPSTSSRCIPYRDIRAAHDFLVAALGLTSGGVVEDGDGTVVHVGGARGRPPHLAARRPAGPGPARGAGPGVGRARRAGRRTSTRTSPARRHPEPTIVSEPSDQDYGQREYGVRDPEGHSWWFATPFGPPGADRDGRPSSDTRVRYPPGRGGPAGDDARGGAQGPGAARGRGRPGARRSGADDVLVEVDLCGVCGSDLHMVLEGWGAPGSWQGHEWIGRVAAVGDGRDRAGSRATRSSAGRPCAAARAPCAGPADRRCAPTATPRASAPEQGAFATYKARRRRRAAAAARRARPPGRRAGRAARRRPARHPPGRASSPASRVLVLGAGPIGALSHRRAAGRWASTTSRCVEPAERRQALAAAVGATTVVHPADLVVPSIAEPGLVVDDAVDVVLECSGKAAAMEAGLAQLVRGGTLVLVGAGIESPRFDPNRILLNELVITGRLHLRPRRLRARRSPCWPSGRPAGRRPARARRGAPRRPARRHARPRRGPAGRKGAGATMTGPALRQGAAVQPRGPVACPPTSSTPTAGPR